MLVSFIHMQRVWKNTRYYVLSGVALSYKDWKFITEDFKSIASTYFKTGNVPEIHTKDLMTGRPPFDAIDYKGLASDIADFILQSHITLFGVVINKDVYMKRSYGPSNTIVNTTLEEIVNRYHLYLQRHRTMGMIVSDASTDGFDSNIRNTYEYFRERGTRFVKLNRIIDTIFFTPSETVIGIQIADFVSYALKRSYENSDSGVFSKIKTKFDHHNGKTHGLKVIE